MATQATYIDRRQCRRDRPMRCLVLGPGRTGTDTMRCAMKILGLDDCYHGYCGVFENPPDNYMWMEAMDAKFEGKGTPYGREQWDRLLGHCQAVTDLPCVAFAEELIAAYPEAKVVLTHPPKGTDRWYNSCVSTIVRLEEDWTRDAWGLIDHESYITRHTFFRSFNYFWRGSFRANAKQVKAEHEQNIRRLVPADRLLEYDVTQGWEPLCRFLDLPKPEQDFPSGNDPQDFFRRFAIYDGRRRRWAMARVALGLTAVALCAWSVGRSA